MIKKHMNTVHNIKVETESLTRKLMCALCIFTFRNMKDLKHHLINVHNKEEHNWMVEEIKTTFACDECEIQFPERALLASHVGSVHNGDRGNVRPTKVVTFKEDEGEISMLGL